MNTFEICTHDGVLAPANPRLIEACQRLRYRVYSRELGLDTPDMDHARAIDVERRDAHCRFVVARDQLGEVSGCVRMQSHRPPSFYAEDEFDLLDPWWEGAALVEGARFVVAAEERSNSVALQLFQAFRDLCRRERRSHLLSVAIVPAPTAEPATLACLLAYVQSRVESRTHLARPARGYETELPTASAIAAAPTNVQIPPMLRLLATARSTLCAPPAYCRRFRTFNFLLVTKL